MSTKNYNGLIRQWPHKNPDPTNEFVYMIFLEKVYLVYDGVPSGQRQNFWGYSESWRRGALEMRQERSASVFSFFDSDELLR